MLTSDSMASTTGQWHIQLFGNLTVTTPSGLQVSLNGKKAGELIAYLALHPTQSHARDKLLTILWADSETFHVRTRLRQEIAAVRSLFPSIADRPDLLTFTSGECHLQVGVAVDSNRFQQACLTARHETDGDAKIRLLIAARDLYRADLLTEYDTAWVRDERDRLNHEYEQVLRDLAEAYQLNKDNVSARQAETSLTSAAKPQHPIPSVARARIMISVFLATALLASVVVIWYSRHRIPHTVSPTAVAVGRHQEKWSFFYQPRVGEVPNAEGRSICADQTGIYVTGLIQTVQDDVDILTVKLSYEGRLLWADRYSSPEHDCDRAFSSCVDSNASMYVGGETYVPAVTGSHSGWYLTLLRYDVDGHRNWVRRSTVAVNNVGQHVQVACDGQNGCYLGGTALVGGKQAILLLRYDSSGKVMWQRVLRGGDQSSFSQFVVGADSQLFVCGSIRHQQGSSGVDDDWTVTCIDSSGKSLWTRFEDGSSHGCDTASRIALDRAGDLFVGGLFNTGDRWHAGKGSQLGVVKYSPDGTRIWRRLVDQSGPAVVLEGIALNHIGSLLVGGTERRLDGTWGVVLARYDSFGNLAHSQRFSAPAGYRNISLLAPMLMPNDEMCIIGQAAPGNADTIRDNSGVWMARYSPDGNLLQQSVFDTGVYAPNIVTDANAQVKLAITGQAGTATGHRNFMVLRY